MTWLQKLRQRSYERKVVNAMILKAIEKVRREEILIKSRPADCYGDDCSTCRCDLAPDCD